MTSGSMRHTSFCINICGIYILYIIQLTLTSFVGQMHTYHILLKIFSRGSACSFLMQSSTILYLTRRSYCFF